MNNLKIFTIIAFALFATIAVNAHPNYVVEHLNGIPVDSVSSNSENLVPISETFNSEQHNKWSKSTNFVKGIEAMHQASSIDLYDDQEEDVDETVPYLNAISFFQKELKQHPKNGYAKCNIAMCKYRIATINLNKYVVSLLYGDSVTTATNEDDYTMKLLQAYEGKSIEKDKDVRAAITILDEGLAMIPAADKETRCKALIFKHEMLSDINVDIHERLNNLTQATSIHPCEDSYTTLISFLTDNSQDSTAISEQTLEKYFKEAATVIPDNEIVKYYLAATEYNNNNYEKALKLVNELCEDNPDNINGKKLRILIYIKLNNYKKAIDEVITLANNWQLDNPYNELAYIINLDKNNNLQLALDAVREQEHKKMASPYDVKEEVVDDTVAVETTPINWLLVEAQILDAISHDYNKALECTQKSLEKEKQNGEELDPSVLSHMGMMYYKLGKVDKALVILDEAAKRAGSFYSSDAVQKMIDIESNCGMTDRVINDAQVLKIINNESSYCYSMLRWAYESKGDWTSAIKAYDQWIELDESSIIAKIMKARALILSGDVENGRELMQQILDNSDFTGNDELKMYTLYYLGRTTESRAILDRLAASTLEVMNMTGKEKDEIESLPEVISLYDAACWYSLHGDSDKAFKFLKLNYESNESNSLCFDYAILDYDFDNVRDNPQFLNILNEYKTRWLKGEYKPIR